MKCRIKDNLDTSFSLLAETNLSRQVQFHRDYPKELEATMYKRISLCCS